MRCHGGCARWLRHESSVAGALRRFYSYTYGVATSYGATGTGEKITAPRPLAAAGAVDPAALELESSPLTSTSTLEVESGAGTTTDSATNRLRCSGRRSSCVRAQCGHVASGGQCAAVPAAKQGSSCLCCCSARACGWTLPLHPQSRTTSPTRSAYFMVVYYADSFIF